MKMLHPVWTLVYSALFLSLPAKVSAGNAPCDTSFFNEVICPGQTYFIAGTIFDAQNSTGSILLPSASWDGTDSVVVVQLTLSPPVTHTIQATFCNNEALFVNGHIYDAGTPSGSELLPGAADGGCDSLIVIDLTFLSPAHRHLQQTICSNDTVWVNNQAYDQHYYLGMETITAGAANGCDSIILVDLTVIPAPSDTLELFLCPGESTTINGTLYNQSRISGLEILPNAAENGCDSLLYVALIFSEPPAVLAFLGPDIVVNFGDTLCFSLPSEVDFETIFWSDGAACTDMTCATACLSPLRTQWVMATITDAALCAFSDTVQIQVTQNRPFYAPNVFSPEATAPNNRFNVYSGVNGASINWLSVYDRWGSLVYTARNFTPGYDSSGWDGTNNGKMVQPGVYTYACEMKYPDNSTEVKSGTVTLVR